MLVAYYESDWKKFSCWVLIGQFSMKCDSAPLNDHHDHRHVSTYQSVNLKAKNNDLCLAFFSVYCSL